VATIRRTPTPIKDIIPLLDEAATEVERLARERDEALHGVTQHMQASGIMAQRDAALADNAALRADAERYRWLRKRSWVDMVYHADFGRGEVSERKQLDRDAAIDAARASGQQEPKS
jgi:hypothetical protein